MVRLRSRVGSTCPEAVPHSATILGDRSNYSLEYIIEEVKDNLTTTRAWKLTD